MSTRFLLAVTLVVICAACTQDSVDPETMGAELLMPFKSNLKRALVNGMEAGPVEAIKACSVAAPHIAEGLSIDGVAMGRSSHKLRNPDNAPQGWLAPILGAYADGSAELAPRAVSIGSDRAGYAEPIRMQFMCLTCHGETLPPGIEERIEALYPDDQATGFKEGDFRGVFWVEFPAS